MVIVGGGFIGAEVAASATQMDTRVTVLEMAETLWTRAVGPEMGRFFEAFLRDRGVHVRTRTKAAAGGRRHGRGGGAARRHAAPRRRGGDRGRGPARHRPGRGGRPAGRRRRPRRPAARAAEGVFAAGDVANAEHPLFGRIRIEHWAEALNQGLLAGRNLAGAGERYDRVPYFFSDQFDLSLSYLGHVREWDELVVRGSREVKEPRFVAWYLREGAEGGPDRQRLGRRGPGPRSSARSAGRSRPAARTRGIKGPRAIRGAKTARGAAVGIVRRFREPCCAERGRRPLASKIAPSTDPPASAVVGSAT